MVLIGKGSASFSVTSTHRKKEEGLTSPELAAGSVKVENIGPLLNN